MLLLVATARGVFLFIRRMLMVVVVGDGDDGGVLSSSFSFETPHDNFWIPR